MARLQRVTLRTLSGSLGLTVELFEGPAGRPHKRLRALAIPVAGPTALPPAQHPSSARDSAQTTDHSSCQGTALSPPPALASACLPTAGALSSSPAATSPPLGGVPASLRSEAAEAAAEAAAAAAGTRLEAMHIVILSKYNFSSFP